MKKILIITISLTLAAPIFVSANGDHGLSVDDVLVEIMEAQNVDEVTSVNCQEVSDEQLEILGEAAMGLIHPNEQQHELMDQMMGGEGSESLEAMHITMGQNYLGCGTVGIMGGGMMGGMNMMSMMGGWSSDSDKNSFSNTMYGMMGSWGMWGGFGIIFVVLFWILAIIGIIALIKWLAGKTK